MLTGNLAFYGLDHSHCFEEPDELYFLTIWEGYESSNKSTNTQSVHLLFSTIIMHPIMYPNHYCLSYSLKRWLATPSPSFPRFTSTNNRIPGVYKKARYVQYSDASFSNAVARTSAEEHLGILGPVIRAEVGDTVKVTFKNMASRAYSIHPRGVRYDKANEGMTYNDNTDGKLLSMFWYMITC